VGHALATIVYTGAGSSPSPEDAFVDHHIQGEVEAEDEIDMEAEL
jgi:hypothetical protein